MSFSSEISEEMRVDLYDRYGGRQIAKNIWLGMAFYLWDGHQSPYYGHCEIKKY